MWSSLYNSPLWLPVLPTLAAVALLWRSRRWPPTLANYVRAFGFLAALDGWLNGPWSPLEGHLATASAVVCVILGDLRYFVAQSKFRRWRSALAWALIVPIATQLLVRLPFAHAPERVVFLTYELGALAVVVAHAVRTRPHQRWFVALLAFELLQYALWALADLVLLAGVELGYLLRVVPNVMYYVGFVPMVAYLHAPRERPCAD